VVLSRFAAAWGFAAPFRLWLRSTSSWDRQAWLFPFAGGGPLEFEVLRALLCRRPAFVNLAAHPPNADSRWQRLCFDEKRPVTSDADYPHHALDRQPLIRGKRVAGHSFVGWHTAPSKDSA
jgi:hypothetical protein